MTKNLTNQKSGFPDKCGKFSSMNNQHKDALVVSKYYLKLIYRNVVVFGIVIVVAFWCTWVLFCLVGFWGF